MGIKLDIISLAVDADMSPVVREFEKDKIVIGRGKNVDLLLDEDDISSKHAIIYVNEDNTLSIEDLGSLNGTNVGDKKIPTHEKFPIGKKDRIMIGDYLIKANYVASKESIKEQEKEPEKEVKKENKKEKTAKAPKKEIKLELNEEKVQEEEEVANELIQDNQDNIEENVNIDLEEELINEDDEKLELEDLLADAEVLDTEFQDNEIQGDEIQDEEIQDEEIQDDELLEDDLFESDAIEDDILNDNKDSLASSHTAEDNKVQVTDEEKHEPQLTNFLSDNELIEEKINSIDDNIFELEDNLLEEENTSLSNNTSNDANLNKNIESTKEEIILESQKKLVEEENKELTNISNGSNTSSESHISTNDSFLIISGTANENIFDINLEAIKLLTLEGQCKRFGVAIPDVIVTFNDEKAITDNNGYFKFTNIEENTPVSLQAEKGGYAFELKNGVTSLTDNAQVIFEGIKTCYISGKILYKGKGLEGVLISNNLGKNILTSQDGSFCIKDIKEGSNYFIKPEKENFIFDIEDQERTLKEDATFIINATKLITISGYIKYKGVPIENVIIDAGELGKTLTDKNGYYEFKNIKEGTQYSIKAYKEGFKFQKA